MVIDHNKLNNMGLTGLVELANLDFRWYEEIGFTPSEFVAIRDAIDEKIKDKLLYIFSSDL